MPLEKLHGALVLLSGRPRRKRAKIAPLASLQILIPRVEAILAGFEFANHAKVSALKRRIGLVALAEKSANL